MSLDNIIVAILLLSVVAGLLYVRMHSRRTSQEKHSAEATENEK